MKLADVMPCKYRVQSSKKNGCQLVAYIDARQAMDHLDSVMTPAKWQDKYYEVQGKVYCSVGLKFEEEWIWKSDCGSESNVEGEKGQASDAFKRACVKWGLGRFLYTKGIVYLRTVEGKDWKNNIIYEPIHDASKGVCPDMYLKKVKGQVTSIISPYKLTEYVRDVLKK